MRSASSRCVGARFVTTFRSARPTTALSRDCTSKPPASERTMTPGARGSGRPPAVSSRRFFLAAKTVLASSVASGAITTSVKILAISSAASASRIPLRATMPPKALTGSQRSALTIGILERAADRHAAGVGVLDDGNRRGIAPELGHQLECGLGIVEIVVGQLLALVLHGRRDAQARTAAGIERRPLMRILAVAQLLAAPAAERPPFRHLIADRRREPAADRRVVGSGARERLRREVLAQIGRRRAAVRPHLGEHPPVVAGLDDDRHAGVVLRRSPNERRAADVDVLDALSESAALPQPWPRRDRG